MKRILILIGLLFFASKAHAESYFSYDYSNDFFTGNDHYYSQGIEIYYGNQNQKSYLIMRPLIGFKNADKDLYSISFHYLGYTPKDPYTPLIQIGDRPFANTAYVRHQRDSILLEYNILLSNSIELGAIGPVTGGKFVQKSIHSATNNKDPLGWRNQIENDLILNYNYALSITKYFFNDHLEFSGQYKGTIGTLRIKNGLAAGLAIGSFRDPQNFNWKIFVIPELWYPTFDATMQGGLINSSSRYRLKYHQMEKLVRKVTYGVSIGSKTFQFGYDQSWISREFKTGSDHSWGHLSLTFRY